MHDANDDLGEVLVDLFTIKKGKKGGNGEGIIVGGSIELQTLPSTSKKSDNWKSGKGGKRKNVKKTLQSQQPQ